MTAAKPGKSVASRACSLAVLTLLAGSPRPVALADKIILRNGGWIEGVAEDFGDAVSLTTPSGTVLVPPNAVERVIPGPTRWTQYERQLTTAAKTAPDQLELARWCARNDLAERAREHLQAALRLDPACPDALREAGYVPTDGVWIKAGPGPLEEAITGNRRVPSDEIARYLGQCWRLRVTSFRDPYTKNGKGSPRGELNESLALMLALDEPLLAPAIAAGLATYSDARARLPMVKALGRFDLDVARLNLIVLVLLEDEADLRIAAIDALEAAKDPRVSQQLRRALACTNDLVVRRSALALGQMRDRSAVEDLIDALAAPPRSVAQIDLAELFDETSGIFDKPVRVPIDEDGASLPAQIADAWRERIARTNPGTGQVRPGTLRTEVQEALITITGENHGFDAAAWAEWLRKNPTLTSRGE